jgi:periplasmic protein TonB
MCNESVSETLPSNASAAQAGFERCLVDGDKAAQSGRRRRRREALGVSLVIETLLLTVVVLAPLTGSVPQLRAPKTIYIPIASGVRHAPRRNLRPEPAQALEHPGRDLGLIYSPGGKSSQSPTRVDNGPSEPPTIGDEADSGASEPSESMFVDLHPAKPAARAEEIKNNGERQPLKLSEPIIQAQLISRVEPRYPPLAVQIHLQGTVLLHAIISRQGTITSLEVASGHPLLVQAALDAVRHWRYRPTMLNGEPVEVETTITVIFQLQR